MFFPSDLDKDDLEMVNEMVQAYIECSKVVARRAHGMREMVTTRGAQPSH